MTEPRHGTRHGYRDDRCRCDRCKKAIALDHNVYKIRRAANGGRPLTVDKTGAVRRLQALMVMGWPRRELARQAGYQGDAFALILNGRRQSLTIATHQRVCDLYERLSMTHGPSSSTRIRASKKGWPPPLAWDDIDDPAEQPHDWQYRPASRADTLAELIEHGAGITEACRVLKIGREGLEKWCQRHGMSAEFRVLAGRETAVFEYANQYTTGVAS